MIPKKHNYNTQYCNIDGFAQHDCRMYGSVMMDANVANVQWFTLAHNCIVVAIDRPKMRQGRRSEHKECNYEDIAHAT
jgi:hypothetical protein